MDTTNTIILYQIEDTVSFYFNSYKLGYHTLVLFNVMYGKKEIILTKPNMILSGLPAGHYYFYCKNDEGKESGDIQVDINLSTQKEYLDNILIANDIHKSPYTDIIHSLDNESYIVDLYKLYKNAESNKEQYETLLTILVNDYNARQEKLNLFVHPLFTFNKNKNIITSFYNLPYTFYVYRYNQLTDQWILEQNLNKYETNIFELSGKSSELYRISVLSDFYLIREYYLYEPSKTLSETILERQILSNKIIHEKTEELLKSETNINNDLDQYKLAAAILDFDITKPILRRPIVEIESDTVVEITIPDYELVITSGKPIYLTSLATTEILSGSQPYKVQVTAGQMKMSPTDFILNSDMEYIFYLTDEQNKKLSQVTLISFNEEYPIEEYANTYRKIQLDRYQRKLYKVFQQYSPQNWNTIALILDKYFLGSEKNISFSEFVIQQLTCLDPNQYDIGFMIQLVLLCDLQHFTDIDVNFVKKQVYAVPYKMHIFPRSDTNYVICSVRISNDEILYQYYRSGNDGTEIRIDQGDIVILQAIDLTTWKKSSIAFYNNKYPGTPYFYFPELEVEVQHGLY